MPGAQRRCLCRQPRELALIGNDRSGGRVEQRLRRGEELVYARGVTEPQARSGKGDAEHGSRLDYIVG